jgi:very-short-patch-repair endonuclease
VSAPLDKGWNRKAPLLQGRGLGWGLSIERIQWLQKRAAEMRRNPTEPEKRLWRHLSNSQLNGHKFRRQAVIGPFIADFLCPQLALIVEVDGDTHDDAKDRLRDDQLAGLGYQVVRVTNHDVMTNMDGVVHVIGAALQGAPSRWNSPHPNPSPEGEGLEEAAAC